MLFGSYSKELSNGYSRPHIPPFSARPSATKRNRGEQSGYRRGLLPSTAQRRT